MHVVASSQGTPRHAAEAAYGVNGSDRERKLELHGHRRLARGWCSWREAVLGHEAGDRFRCCCSLDPSHRPTATNARIKVGLKNVFQKPAPAPPSRRAAVITLQELELIASGGWWPALERIVFGLGNHFAAERGVTREHAETTSLRSAE